VSGWESLTDAEVRVARAVSEGLTTSEAARRLFLSPHTVNSHVRHAFRKLAIRSRVELTRIVLAHPEEGV
jgi:DNA-binding CsgD family transcriptional regulator